MDRAYVPVRFLKPLVDLVAKEEDQTPTSILRETGISLRTLTDEDAAVTFDQQVRFYEKIAAISTISGTGFRSPSVQSFADQGMLGALMVLAPTVGEAFLKVEEFSDAMGGMVKYQVRVEEKYLYLSTRDKESLSPKAHELVAEENLALWKSFGMLILGLEGLLKEIHVDYARPFHWRMYADLFPTATIRFDQSEIAAVLSIEAVDYTIQTQNPEAFQEMEKICTELLDRIQPTTKAIVEEYLSETSPVNWSATNVADGLNMTPKMLSRRLGAEDTSTKQVIETNKYNHALSLLDHGFNDSEIASKLGYANNSSFARAFTKWAGLTPTSYRQKTLVAL